MTHVILLNDKLEGTPKHNDTFHFSEEQKNLFLTLIYKDHLLEHKIQFILKSYSTDFK